jgi:hypothetical protein
MRIRVLFVAALLGTFVLGAAAPASATIDSFVVEHVNLRPSTDDGESGGTITCTSGDTFRVSIRVDQKTPGYRGSGFTTGTCTGSSQGWAISFSRDSGDMVQPQFAGGVPTRIVHVAKTFSAGVENDKVFTSITV